MEVPTIYTAYFLGLCKGISPQNMANNMVQYLHFRILKLPLRNMFTHFLTFWVFLVGSEEVWLSINGRIPKWVVQVMENPIHFLKKYMVIMGYPHFRKPPFQIFRCSTIQCEAPVRQRSVGEHNSKFTMVYGTQITIVTGENLNHLITGQITIVTGAYKPTNITGGGTLYGTANRNGCFNGNIRKME